MSGNKKKLKYILLKEKSNTGFLLHEIIHGEKYKLQGGCNISMLKALVDILPTIDKEDGSDHSITYDAPISFKINYYLNILNYRIDIKYMIEDPSVIKGFYIYTR
ncbi:hypothetical protein [Neisseria sp. Ec49-e6-T10]|uniref:hypothetical protein n=1 Tax=Neisseria sp. Ec49-e6-T10 TaxID=3140744 RepID=UPI003EBD6819